MKNPRNIQVKGGLFPYVNLLEAAATRCLWCMQHAGNHQGLGELCSKNRSWWTPHQKRSDCFKNEYTAEQTIWNCRKFQTWICKHHYIKKFNPKDGPKGLANAITNPMVIGKELIALIEALKLTDPGLRALVMHGAELPRQAVHITWKDKATWPAYARTWHGMASSVIDYPWHEMMYIYTIIIYRIST